MGLQGFGPLRCEGMAVRRALSMPDAGMDMVTRPAMACTGESSGVINRSATQHQWLRSAVSLILGWRSSHNGIAQGLARLRLRWVSSITAQGTASM